MIKKNFCSLDFDLQMLFEREPKGQWRWCLPLVMNTFVCPTSTALTFVWNVDTSNVQRYIYPAIVYHHPSSFSLFLRFIWCGLELKWRTKANKFRIWRRRRGASKWMNHLSVKDGKRREPHTHTKRILFLKQLVRMAHLQSPHGMLLPHVPSDIRRS